MASIVSKVKKATTNYAKNVVGGAKIVGSAVSSAVKKVSGTSQSGAVLNATTLPGAKLNPSNLVTGSINKTGAQIASESTKKSTPTTTFKGFGGGASGGSGTGFNFQTGQAIPSTSLGGSASNSRTSSSTNTLSSNALTPGQFGATSFSQTSPSRNSSSPSLPTTNVVNNSTLRSTSPITLPEPTVQDYSALIPPAVVSPDQKATNEADTAFKDFTDQLLKNEPSSADAYAKAQKQTQILNKQKVVNDLTGKLNAIVNQGQANQLAVVGQGRGIPEAIIGGQQAQIGRETAIAALPVQAQLSAAQGDLEMAQSNLETLFKIYSDDAKNSYEHRLAVKKAVYERATDKEKVALEKAAKLEERAYNETQKVIETNKNLSIQAAKNGAPASILSKIANATNLDEAISIAGKYLVDTQVVKLGDGSTVIIDSTGKVVKNLGGATSSSNNYIITKDTLKNTFGNDVVGMIANTIKSSGAKQSQSTNDAINVISGLQSFAKNNADGSFEGLNPILRTPDKFASDQARTNRSDIEAINLKVQQWASGAALTDAQTKQVEKITPKTSDTDAQIKSKTNALANYMVSQVSGQLAGQGVSFITDRVDLFTKTPEQELADLYKDPIIKQKIIEASQMFPNYTDAEILQIVTP